MRELFKAIEDVILKHRYLYYVKNNPIVSDYEYDLMEAAALLLLPKDSIIQTAGSDLEESYPDYIIKENS